MCIRPRAERNPGFFCSLAFTTVQPGYRLTNPLGTTTSTWDARNRLAALSGPGLSASFQYDALGRRSSKTLNGTPTAFLYDGVNPVQELTNGVPTANLLTGLRVDEVFSRMDAAGARFFLPDALGSTVALTDSTGAVQTQYTYEPFGQTTVSGAASGNPFQYTGRENDGTGLYYYRARYYHSTLQRFISEDPIEFDAGDINLYAYVFNDPVNWTDPMGLASLVTNMKGRTTTFDPRPEDPNGVPLTIPTSNDVDRRSKPGARDPFKTPDVNPIDRSASIPYGPEGAYIDTGDPRGRDIHGGGSCRKMRKRSQEPYQGWCPTFGCTRGQNANVQELGSQIREFKQRHPGVPVPYRRY